MSALHLKIIRTFLTAGILQNLNSVGFQVVSVEQAKFSMTKVQVIGFMRWLSKIPFINCCVNLKTKMLLSKFTREHISFWPCKVYSTYALQTKRWIVRSFAICKFNDLTWILQNLNGELQCRIPSRLRLCRQVIQTKLWMTKVQSIGVIAWLTIINGCLKFES